MNQFKIYRRNLFEYLISFYVQTKMFQSILNSSKARYTWFIYSNPHYSTNGLKGKGGRINYKITATILNMNWKKLQSIHKNLLKNTFYKTTQKHCASKLFTLNLLIVTKVSRICGKLRCRQWNFFKENTILLLVKNHFTFITSWKWAYSIDLQLILDFCKFQGVISLQA